MMFRKAAVFLAGVLASVSVFAEPPDPIVQFLEARVQRDPLDYIAWSRLADRYLQLLRLQGEVPLLAKAERAAAASLQTPGAERNFGGIGARGRVELAGHHFHEALATAKLLQELQPQKSGGLLIFGDASLELGDVAAAEQAFLEINRREKMKTTAIESRLGRIETVRGHLESAAAHWQRALAIAEEQDATPEMLAWVLVQIGELAFKQGDWDEAEKSYRAALENLPGWYVTEEHLAELQAARGDYPGAAAAYEKIVQRLPRPELLQALGDVYAFAKKPEQAKPWHERARAAYLEYEHQGAVMFWHHGSGFFADSVGEPATALEWARRDVALRPNVYAWDALAWAQYQSGDVAGAAETLPKAMATGIKDPHLLYHAGMIRMGAGDLAGGKAALQEAVTVNPRYNTFHVHR